MWSRRLEKQRCFQKIELHNGKANFLISNVKWKFPIPPSNKYLGNKGFNAVQQRSLFEKLGGIMTFCIIPGNKVIFFLFYSSLNNLHLLVLETSSRKGSECKRRSGNNMNLSIPIRSCVATLLPNVAPQFYIYKGLLL